jgi:hypothetical protein
MRFNHDTAGMIKAQYCMQSDKVGFEITGMNAVARCWFGTDHNIFTHGKLNTWKRRLRAFSGNTFLLIF